jgi:AcrR family transcriptional regulator
MSRTRELQRSAVRSAITDAATALFLERGYDATTMDDIAAAVGISVRTLFRYISTKEETLLGPMTETGAVLAERIRTADARLSGREALVGAVTWFAKELDAEGDLGKARSRLLVETPQLRGGLSDKRRVWLDEMAPAVQQRLSTTKYAAITARALVAGMLAALDVVAEHWAYSDSGYDLPVQFRSTARLLT